MKKEIKKSRGQNSISSTSEEESVGSVSEASAEKVKKDEGASGISNLLSKFQRKIHFSSNDKRKASNFRPAVLKEVLINVLI